MTTPNLSVSEDQIRAIAYRLWLEEGQPEGRAEHHWYRANELAAQEFSIPTLEISKPKRKSATKKAKNS